jgi:hypothetical protein
MIAIPGGYIHSRVEQRMMWDGYLEDVLATGVGVPDLIELCTVNGNSYECVAPSKHS